MWEQSPSTLPLYSTPQVCVEDEATGITTTLSNDHELTNANSSSHVLNCGHCGKCSNRHDIQVYEDTRNTLTKIATQCTLEAFYAGLDINHFKPCLEKHSQLSPPCVDCWVLNVECNWKHCFKTCVKHKAPPFRWLPSYYQRSHSSPLDPCIECDERMCGPLFIDCAGANRRRVGVVSDLQRDANLEICHKVDWEWIWVQSKKESVVEERATIHNQGDASSSSGGGGEL